jgi:hypothetical protein
MMKKAIPYILLLLMAWLGLVIKKCKDSRQPESKRKITVNDNRRKDPSEDLDRDRDFDRRISYLEYSTHAKCRMQCRQISQAEVEEIMLEGKINYNKSDFQNKRCPRYAIESITTDNQRVRIIFAQCNEKTEVVTVIDLDTNRNCHCPGD